MPDRGNIPASARRVGAGRKILGLILLGCAASFCITAATMAYPPERGGSLVIRAGRVMPVADGAPWVIEGGVIVIRDGRIEAIGAEGEVVIPPDLPVVSFPDETVMPGMIAAACNLAGFHRGVESVSGAYSAVDAFDAYADYRVILAGGVTAVHLDPGRHRLISGVGAVVRLGGMPTERVLSERSALQLNFLESAYSPPLDFNYIFPASSDVAIEPGRRQAPDSRLGQQPTVRAAMEAALGPTPDAAVFDYHRRALGAWISGGGVMRVRADRAGDLRQAIEFLRDRKGGVVVSGGEVNDVMAELGAANLPLVFEVPLQTGRPAGNLGTHPDVLARRVEALEGLADIPLALTVGEGHDLRDMRLAAATALRAGLDERRVIEGVTRRAAEILGVGDRIGSLVPGKDADLLVLSGDPLSTTTHVRKVYVRGATAFEPPSEGALVVRAGTVWVSPERVIEGGEVLIEGGKVAAVGRAVPRPPYAKVVDAGDDAVITPGFIDARGHLGLRGDGGSPGPDVKLSKAIGVPDVTDLRTAAAGVTTVALSPYRGGGTTGAQVSAIKSGGRSRADRVIRDTAAVMFDVSDTDPPAAAEQLKKRLEAGKKYLESWQKYEKELKEWEEKQKSGQATEAKPEEKEQTTVVKDDDPITGTWSGTLSGGPLPNPETGKVALRLTGTQIEGRVVEPAVPVDHKITGTFDGEKGIKGQIEVDTQGNGYPEFELTLDRADHMTGVIRFMGITVNVEGERVEKKPVEFKVERSKTRGKDGRPLAPKVDEGLEPLKLLLEKKIPAVVRVSAHTQIDAVVKLIAEEFELPLTLVDAEEASVHAARLAEKKVGVILPVNVVRTRQYVPYVQGDDLSRAGVAVAFQSDAEDGARSLREVGMYAVERGMSAEAALAALTTNAARLLRIDDRVGSLEPGRDGDLVIFDGPPFEAGTSVRRVIINGEEVR